MKLLILNTADREGPKPRYERVLSLRPTQFSLGMEQIKVKTKELQALSAKKLKKTILGCPVPVIISPNGELYLIDHHHLLYCLWQMGVEKVPVEIRGDLSHTKLSYKKFWDTMARSHWTYLYDQFGEGPRSPLYLPENIKGLADDPYRSLAWAVRRQGGFETTQATFAEFQWANYFREQQLLEENGRSGFKKAVKKALKSAYERRARKLPGFKGRKDLPTVTLKLEDRAAA